MRLFRSHRCLAAFGAARLLLAAMLAGLCLAPPATGAHERIRRGPAPDWVAWLDPDLSPTSAAEADASGGLLMLLFDRQVHVTEETEFFHKAVRLLNPFGAEQLSSLQFDFHPSYQTLTLHRLRIHRDGQTFDRTNVQVLRAREREPTLEWNLYFGMLSAEALLEDIRPGDVVEWAYSLRGRNPVFGGRFADSYSLVSFTPLRRFRILARLPEEDPDRILLTVSPDAAPDAVRREGAVVLAEARQLEPAVHANDAPSWHNPHPWFALGEYRDWADVVNWAVPLYAMPDPLPDELERVRQTLLALPDEPARILAALRYARDTLRYVSLSAGLHSHKPYPVEDVLRRRFGDCKDKAVLATVLLRSIGLDAWPALVNTHWLHKLAEMPPSPLSFDHVIVAVRRADGDWQWLDPTDSHARGPLHSMFVQRYGYALLIRPGETDLRAMPGAGYEATLHETAERFTLPAEADGPVRLHVRTRYQGREADIMRAHLASHSLRSLQDHYQDYYAKRYRDAEPVEPVRTTDCEESNVLILEENWRLPDPWKPAQDGTWPFMEFEPVFSDLIRDIPASLRIERPYPLYYPKRARHSIVVELPFPLSVSGIEIKRENDFLRFAMTETLHDRTLTVRYEFETLSDHVPAAHLAAHVGVLEEIGNQSNYMLYHPWTVQADAGAFTPNYALILLGVALWAGFLFWGRARCQRPCPPVIRREELLRQRPDLNGLSGWLLLPILGLILSLILSGANLIREGYHVYDADVWDYLATGDGAQGSALWGPYFLFQIVCAAWALGFTPALLIATFRKKCAVPRTFILFFIVNILFSALEMAFVLALGTAAEELDADQATAQLVRNLVGGVIWISYFRQSVRVKIVFSRHASRGSGPEER